MRGLRFKHKLSAWRQLWLFGLLLCLLVSQAPAPLHAQGGQPQTRVSDPVWQASYWNNIDLAGAPVLVRSEPEINYNWGSGSPAPEVNGQRFSARWTRYIYFESDGLYRFSLTSDDGARFFLDDQLLVDAWYDHAAKTFVVDRQLRAGHHLLRVEYYNNGSPALVQFTWTSLDQPQPTITEWRGEYFNNRDLLGDPVLVRNDPSLDFNWGLGSPAPGVVNADNFSARWTRTLNLPSGSLSLPRHRGRRRAPLCEQPAGDRPVARSGRRHLPPPSRSPCPARRPIKVEYFEATGDARIQVAYERTEPPDATRGRRLARRVLQQHRPSPARPPWCAMIPTSTSTGASARRPRGVNSDDFTVRWTRTFQFAPGNYRFRIIVDDGARLWVNNALIIDQWQQQSATEYSSDIYVPGGAIPHSPGICGIPRAGHRQALLGSDRRRVVGGGGGSGRGNHQTRAAQEQVAGRVLQQPRPGRHPALVREDKSIDFDWGYGSPDPAINPDNFSVRWTNTFRFDAGVHRFTTETDDGVRLWVDNKLIIDKWGVQARTKHSGETRLSAGNHTVRMEYQELGGYAFAKLTIVRIVEGTATIGNIVTCVPPQPPNYAWIKLYRLDTNNRWVSMGRGIGAINPTGFLKIDGLPVDVNRFGNAGEPYKVEQWIDGKVARSTGDFLRGEPEFRVRPFADNATPWGCSR